MQTSLERKVWIHDILVVHYVVKEFFFCQINFEIIIKSNHKINVIHIKSM